MANEAQKEPTMEEILASIRRIIAEDDGDAKRSAAQDDEGDVLSADDILGTDALDEVEEPEETSAFEGAIEEDDDLMPLTDDSDEFQMETVEIEEGASDEPELAMVEDEDFDLEDLEAELSGDDFAEDEVVVTEPDEDEVEFDVVSEPEEVVEETVEPVEMAVEVEQDEPDFTEETNPMAAKPRTLEEPLTDDTAATAAASSMSKLLGKMDLGGEHTVEGLVRELLKPMIKAWLDENLPRIVEAKVEEEVQRISRLASR